jgi:hypothetical protein
MLFIQDLRRGARNTHEFEKSEKFARFFFDNIIPLRLSDSNLKEPGVLQKLVAKGYIGIIPSGQILPENDKPQADITSWFPNRQIADGWLGLIR